MANFTLSQANACKITIMEKIVKGSDILWLIGLMDADNNHYDIRLNSLEDNMSKSEVKSVILTEVLNLEKIPAPISKTVTKIGDKGLGETLEEEF